MLEARALEGIPVRSTSSRWLATAAVALALLVACRADAPTSPIGRPALPADPSFTLTGGVGTLIFPIVPPGEIQPVGYAIGLNNAGEVTGAEFGMVHTEDTNKPYRWSPATGPQKIVVCCDTQYGVDINDAGVIVGNAQTDAVIGMRGFVAAEIAGTKLSILPGADVSSDSRAFAINLAGQIVGVSFTPNNTIHAVMWSGPSNTIQDLGTLGGSNSEAVDINSSGQVIGMSHTAGNAATHAFLWSSGGGMVDLNTMLGAAITDVVEINDAGQIVGTYTVGGQSHAFLYTPGSGLRDLGTLGGTFSTPTGLNGLGDVVGSSTTAGGTTHAFLWTKGDGMEDVTAITGVPEIRRLNDKLQTLTGTAPPTSISIPITISNVTAKIVQLQVSHNTAPAASFSVSCTGLTCTFDASGSTDDAPGLTFAWDLNKAPGGSATGVKVTTIYPHLGQRTITLKVTDAGGLTSTTSKTIDISALPVAAFTVRCTGLTCTFDGTSSTDDGGIRAYSWNLDRFPGGSATGAKVTTTYAHSGPRNVTLTVTDAQGQTSTITKTVNVGATSDTPPVAAFTWSCTELTCSFDASTSTDDLGITSYGWNLDKFPNGSASGVKVSTTYPHTGQRNVTLTVTDTKGQTNSVTHTINVQ
jgi:probable HAF family extracellular repeat protein